MCDKCQLPDVWGQDFLVGRSLWSSSGALGLLQPDHAAILRASCRKQYLRAIVLHCGLILSYLHLLGARPETGGIKQVQTVPTALERQRHTKCLFKVKVSRSLRDHEFFPSGSRMFPKEEE
jgi:hypothetical protein